MVNSVPKILFCSLDKKLDKSVTGQSSGCLANSDSLMRAVDAMIRETEVNAVAVVTRFPDDSIEDIIDYRQGEVR